MGSNPDRTAEADDEPVLMCISKATAERVMSQQRQADLADRAPGASPSERASIEEVADRHEELLIPANDEAYDRVYDLKAPEETWSGLLMRLAKGYESYTAGNEQR